MAMEREAVVVTALGSRVDPDTLRTAIGSTLERALARELASAPDALATPIRYAVLSPGKRIRPLLLVGAWRAAGGDPDRPPPAGVLELAAGVELVHAYSLIHDDLPCMDDDELRRGRPTVHVKFGVATAILAGAALMPLAVRIVVAGIRALDLAEDTGLRVVGSLARASGGAGMVGGQLLDLEAERSPVDAPRLERIHLGKTARLIEASCEMGGLAAGAPEAVVSRLRGFGRRLGLAFQVVDDILDVTGSAGAMGKTRGRDEALGKATFPALLGIEGARERARDLVKSAREVIQPLERADLLQDIATLVIERDR